MKLIIIVCIYIVSHVQNSITINLFTDLSILCNVALMPRMLHFKICCCFQGFAQIISMGLSEYNRLSNVLLFQVIYFCSVSNCVLLLCDYR